MKKLTLILAILALGTTASWAGTVCPAAGGANPFPHAPDPNGTGCNVLITIAVNGTVSITVLDATPYEESEDVLVGVLNNSGVSINSINLTGSGIFGFEGDGICIYTFVGSGYCTALQRGGADPEDYAGPTSTFSNFATANSGTVNFAPGIPANGGKTYFSLEGAPTASITATVGSTGPSGGTAGAPALSTWGMMLLVVLLVGLSLRMMKQKSA